MATRAACLVCQIIENKVPSKKVYEDELAIAVLDVNGSNPGHCFVMPKNHYPILEQVPDAEIGSLFNISNRISSAIFESFGAQGTNIFVANGIPAGQTVAHFIINVIPRKENDGINFALPQKAMEQKEVEAVGDRIAAALSGSVKEEKAEKGASLDEISKILGVK